MSHDDENGVAVPPLPGLFPTEVNALRDLAVSCNHLASKLSMEAGGIARGDIPLDIHTKMRLGADLREVEKQFGATADVIDPPESVEKAS